MATEKVRQRKIGKYKSFRLTKKIPHPAGPLPSAWRLLGKTRRLMWANKKSLLVVLVVYFSLTMILVRNFSSPLNVTDVKNNLQQSLGVTPNRADTASTVFGLLIGSAGTTSSETSGIYQGILLLVIVLVTIWIYRQFSAGKKPTAKQAFYTALYPVVPFLLVVLVMILQFVPALIGGELYSTVVGGGLAVSAAEKGLWILLFFFLAVLSIYMLCSSIFALFIVTLPDMTPLKALRSARQLVLSRRIQVLRKFVALLLLGIAILLLIIIPTIYFAAAITPWLYLTMSLFAVLFLCAYLFTIYKELL